MSTIANLVVGLVALVHVYILVLEMFLWDKPAGLRAFGQTREAAAASKVLAANQGLYNGFLAAGLFWGLSLGAAGIGIKVFFLGGGCCGHLRRADGQPQDPVVQAVPAAIGLLLVLLRDRKAGQHDVSRQQGARMVPDRVDVPARAGRTRGIRPDLLGRDPSGAERPRHQDRADSAGFDADPQADTTRTRVFVASWSSMPCRSG